MPNFEQVEVESYGRKRSTPKPIPLRGVMFDEPVGPSKPHECIIHAVRGPENAAFWHELERAENLPPILNPFVRRTVEPTDGWGMRIPVGMWGATLQEWNEVVHFASQLEHWNHEHPQLMVRILDHSSDK